MAYKNFIPTVWAEQINRELEKAYVFADGCNTEYEGDVAKAGDTVRILGVGKPTITSQDGGKITLQDAETVEDTSVSMPITHTAFFNYAVDDIDKRQAVGGLMDALSKESTLGLAEDHDKLVANLVKDPAAIKLNKSGVIITKENVLETIDKGLEMLYTNNVTTNSEIELIIPPWFYTLFKQAYIKADTNNSEMLKNGIVARYGNAVVKMSNNVVVDGGLSLCMLRTKKACAFANPMTHTEAYRPEKAFSDAVKGFTLSGAKLVRPKELVVLNVKANG